MIAMLNRTWRLLRTSLHASLLTGMQYRADFIVEGLMSLMWFLWNLLPLFVLYHDRKSVAGWDFPSALLVISWFIMLRALLEGMITPSFVDTVERIRSGAFDYVLLRPADSQFLASTSRFAPWRIIDFIGGLGLARYSFVQLGHGPSLNALAMGVMLLVFGLLAMYALWMIALAASFWVVRLDNLTYLLEAIFDTARWPVQVFRGGWRFLFTFVIPLALMTTYPAMAMLGRLPWSSAGLCVAGALALLAASRGIWLIAIRSYTSASS